MATIRIPANIERAIKARTRSEQRRAAMRRGYRQGVRQGSRSRLSKYVDRYCLKHKKLCRFGRRVVKRTKKAVHFAYRHL